MDSSEYMKKQEELLVRYESLCKRCGACCGASGSDPCANLAKHDDGTYYCRAYETRLGAQVTVMGKKFTCVPIQLVLEYNAPSLECGYRLAHGAGLMHETEWCARDEVSRDTREHCVRDERNERRRI
jgi:uncharacterized cysteine cluster protein YcgN (CxxCxxCC family)